MILLFGVQTLLQIPTRETLCRDNIFAMSSCYMICYIQFHFEPVVPSGCNRISRFLSTSCCLHTHTQQLSTDLLLFLGPRNYFVEMPWELRHDWFRTDWPQLDPTSNPFARSIIYLQENPDKFEVELVAFSLSPGVTLNGDILGITWNKLSLWHLPGSTLRFRFWCFFRCFESRPFLTAKQIH